MNNLDKNENISSLKFAGPDPTAMTIIWQTVKQPTFKNTDLISNDCKL